MMLDEDIWDNTKQFDYLFECARKKGLTTAVAIAEESGVDCEHNKQTENRKTEVA